MALAACSESSQPLPQEVQFQFTGGIPECDYQSIQRQVYFDRPERKAKHGEGHRPRHEGRRERRRRGDGYRNRI
jgi:hypothetical protein